MKIRYLYPRAEQEFRLELDDFRGFVLWQISLPDKVLSQGQCSDPPCHELIYLPREAEDRPLEVALSRHDLDTGKTDQRLLTLLVKNHNEPEEWVELRWL